MRLDHRRLMTRWLGAISLIAIAWYFGTDNASTARAEGGLNGVFCAAFPFDMTLSGMYRESDAVVVATWIASTPPVREEDSGTTRFKVKRVLKRPKHELKVDTEVLFKAAIKGKKDQQFVLMASSLENELAWRFEFDAPPELVDYLTKFPFGKSETDQLLYYLKFLGHAHQELAEDAEVHITRAGFANLKLVAKQLPREKLQKWVADPKMDPGRLRLYGEMLGISGHREDAEILERRIFGRRKDEDTLSLGGLMGGYLALAGDKGLKKLEEKVLKDKQATESEVYAVVYATTSSEMFAPGGISAERLKSAMLLVLDHPEVADQAVEHFEFAGDWSMQERIEKMYSTVAREDPLQNRSLRRSIILYMLASEKDVPKDSKVVPPHAKRAREFLETIRKQDPQGVQAAEGSRKGFGM